MADCVQEQCPISSPTAVSAAILQDLRGSS